MKKITFLLLICCLIFACAEPKEDKSMDEVALLGDEIDFSAISSDDFLPTNTSFDSLMSTMPNKIGSESPAAPSQIPDEWDDLTDMISNSKIFVGTASGSLTIPGVGITLEKNQSSVAAYKIAYKPVSQGDTTAYYGSGYALFYTFRQLKRGLNASNIPQVAASIELGDSKTYVEVTLQTFGMASNQLYNVLVPTANMKLDVSKYADIQSRIDLIETVLTDSVLFSRVKITPRPLNWLIGDKVGQ